MVGTYNIQHLFLYFIQNSYEVVVEMQYVIENLVHK